MPIENGGTGSSTQNFVDLNTNQTVGGTKTFSSEIVGNLTGNLTGNVSSSLISLENGETITNNIDGTVLINGTVSVGSGSSTGIVASNGNNDLKLQTGNSTTGSITIENGVDGNIILSTNGLGSVMSTTPTAGDNSNKVATTAFVRNELATGIATNVSGIVEVTNGGTGASNPEEARNNLGLYTGVYSISVSNAGSITIPFEDILPSGVIPTADDMIIFFSNYNGLVIMNSYVTDTNFDLVNDSFSVQFNASQTGTLKISYYVAI